MRIVRSLSEISWNKQSVVTVGTFDGIHRAHLEIIREVVNRAHMREGRSVLVTFDPHPKEVVASVRGPVRLLMTLDERIALLELLKVDLLFVIPFTLEFSRLSSREFFEQYVVNGIGVSEVVVGYDHMFGRNREAGIDELVHMGKEFDFSVFAVHAYTVDGETVSSTRIRKALVAGDVDRAARLQGRPYSLSGTVIMGDRRGAVLGFPTANIRPLSEQKVVPGHGVYLVEVTTGDMRRYGMMNIGVRPTVAEGSKETIEVHLFDFSGDLYGKQITVTFLRRLRDERRFSSLQELTDQLHLDREESLRYLAEYVKS
jgi:riboflavin kinase/FMN adenylyltransferase